MKVLYGEACNDEAFRCGYERGLEYQKRLIENTDPPQPGDEPERPPAVPHDPIEPDPMNPKSEPSLPATEPQPEEPPGWDWAEHED